MLAEQVLLGPTTKILLARDRMGIELPQETRLGTLSVLVMYSGQPSSNIQVTFNSADGIQVHHVPKGTRMFEIMIPHPRFTWRDSADFDIPWDYPIHRPLNLTQIECVEPTEVDCNEALVLSPTESFEAEEPPETSGVHQQNHVNALMSKARQVLNRSVTETIHSFAGDTKQMQLINRMRVIAMNGPAVGDDEMSNMLHSYCKTNHTKLVGILMWNQHKEEWMIHDKWQCDEPFSQVQANVMTLFVNNHWLAARIDLQQGIMEYWDICPLQVCHMHKLLQLLPATKQFQINFHAVSSCYGWCGFHAIKSLSMNSEVEIENGYEPQLIDQYLEPTMLNQYVKSMQCPDRQIMLFALQARNQFIAAQVASPTDACFHGNGKDNHATLRCKGHIASVLIARGHETDEALKVADELASIKGTDTKGLHTMKEQRAYSTILELCIKHNVSMKHCPKDAAIRRLQSFFRAKQNQKNTKQSVMVVDVHQIQFQPQTFMVQNGEYVVPSKTWSPSHRGIGVSTRAEVQRYADLNKLLTDEPNSVITSEMIVCKSPLRCDQITIQVQDLKQNAALVRLFVTHFGGKPVIKVPSKDAQVDLPATRTIAITVYRNLVEDQVWHELQKGPAKLILNIIRNDPDNMKASQLWSRRWSVGTKPCEPSLASQFSMLASVGAEDVNTWLRRSGLTNPSIFISCKRDQNCDENQTAYRIIWTGKQLCETVAATSQAKQHAGIVHKAPSSYGVRVLATDFTDTWKLLKGTVDPPVQVAPNHKYIMSALPQNANGNAIEVWGQTLGWKIRVLKKMSDRRYLIAAESEVPAKHLSFNKSEILIEPYVEMPKRQSSILAGKLQIPAEEEENFDPWQGKKLGEHPATRVNKDAWGAYVPTGSQQHRMPSMPVSNSTDNARLDQVETDLKQLKEHLQNQQRATQQQFQQVDQRIAQVNSSLQASMMEALQEQSRSLLTSFEQLIRQAPKAGTPREESNRSRSPKHRES